MAEENKIGEISVPQDKFSENLFALKINGDSMIDAGIFHEDIVVIDKGVEPKNGDIGAFMINETEATVKYLDTIGTKDTLFLLIKTTKSRNYFKCSTNRKSSQLI